MDPRRFLVERMHLGVRPTVSSLQVSAFVPDPVEYFA
jgi:hypothetical protein